MTSEAEHVEEVAKGLTKAQRQALNWLSTGNVAASDAFYGHSKEQPRRPTLTALVRRGLARCKVWDTTWEVSILPLGLAVRQHLLEQEAQP